MPSLDQIRQSIEARLTELQSEIVTLETARAALHASAPTAASNGAGAGPAPSAPTVAANGAGGDAAPTRAPRPRRARRKPRKSEQRVEVLLAGKLEAMLGEAQDGLSAITISKRANAGYKQVRDLLRELEASGQVRRTGTRRTSVWKLITEEEQIAERAAELERLSLARRGA